MLCISKYKLLAQEVVGAQSKYIVPFKHM